MASLPLNTAFLRPPSPARNRPLILGTLAGMSLVLACLADWWTGPEVAFSILYLAPIGLVAWRAGRWPGLLTAGLCGIVWLLVELGTTAGYSSLWIPYWNALVRLTFFTLVSVLLSEIVERKRVESALERQRGILQSILDSMKEGVIVASQDGQLLLMNPAAAALLDVEEIRPATSIQLLEAGFEGQSGAGQAGREVLTRALRGELISEAEIVLECAAAPERWLRIHGRPWLDPSGRNHGGMAVMSDITAARSLERQIADISDREQRRLGQDLHDGLCQQLVSMTFAMRTLADKLAAQRLAEAVDARRIAELLDQSITLARDVARGLYLVHLESGGLASALEELAMQVRARHHLDCQFQDGSASSQIVVSAMNDLFRIAQEAVSNAVKHAAARKVIIRLEAGPSQVGLHVQDDGRGMTLAAVPDHGLGIHMMRHRARIIGAELRIESSPGQGTTVSCVLPRDHAQRATPAITAPTPNA